MEKWARILAGLICVTMLLSADVTPQQRYIDKFAGIAVQEMYRSGVPASITLAQGLLESRYGLSALAAEGHNHFGIKCHNDWKGKTMKVDDDKKGECFRVYDEDSESFRDHSDFLRYRDRYKFLFDYDVTDYKSWAYGLSKAGYATDPQYPSKLIRLVEEYDLGRYDKAKPADFKGKDVPLNEKALYPAKGGKDQDKEGTAKETKEEKKARIKAGKQAKSTSRTSKGKKKEEEPEISNELPQSPTELEEAVVVEKSVQEEFHFSTARKIYSLNGVPFVYANEGETYASLAEDNKLFHKEILRINDLDADCTLAPGTVVYLQTKKSQARKGLNKYIVEEDGESLRDICQRFAVKKKSIEKMNGFTAGHELRAGDTILLR